MKSPVKSIGVPPSTHPPPCRRSGRRPLKSSHAPGTASPPSWRRLAKRCGSAAVGWNPRQFDMDQNPTSRTWSGKWKSSPFPFGVPGIKTLEPLPSSCGVHSSSHGYSGISIRIRFPYSSCMSISQIQCFDPVTFIYLRRFHVL